MISVMIVVAMATGSKREEEVIGRSPSPLVIKLAVGFPRKCDQDDDNNDDDVKVSLLAASSKGKLLPSH